MEQEEVDAYAGENGLIYMETSAKSGLNVREIFVAIGACRRAAAAGGDKGSRPAR